MSPSHPQQQEPAQNQRPYSPMNRSNIPLNQRINPDFNPRAGIYSPSRANQQPNHTQHGRRFGSPPQEDTGYNSVGSDYGNRQAQPLGGASTLRNRYSNEREPHGFQHQPRFTRSQPRSTHNQPVPVNSHKPLNTESRIVPQNQGRGYSNITPKKLTYNSSNQFKDFTSIGAIDLAENGMGFELNGSLFTYGGDQRAFLERISTQEYQGRFERGWDAYIAQCTKEIDFVDQVIATGGRGQGETVNIPKDYGSKFTHSLI
jgi:hypothetical protein